MGSSSGATRTPPTVDSSDRELFVKAAENGNKPALERFDAALNAQHAAGQSAQTVDGGGNNNGLTDQELAEKYAPVLVLPDRPYDFPGDPQEFIDNSELRLDRSFWPDKGLGNNNNADSDDDFTAERVGASEDAREFLDLDDDQRGEIRHTEDNPAPFFYQVTRSDDPAEPTKVTYFFFYAYNDGPSFQNHEGDWERITLEFDPLTEEPTQAIYSAHNNSHTKPVPYGELHKDDETGRPLVYVASGSHASYTTPGVHPTEVPGLNDQTATDVDGDGRIENNADGDGRMEEGEEAYYLDTAGTLFPIVQQDFYPDSGRGLRWGQIGLLDDLPKWNSATSGPYGPSEEKGHVELKPDEGPQSGPPSGTTTTTAPPAAGPTTTIPGQTPGTGPTPTTVAPPTGTTTTTIPD